MRPSWTGLRGAAALRIVVALVVLAAVVQTLLSWPDRGWKDPEPSLRPSRSEVANRTLDALRDEGLRFTGRQEDALRRLITLWERREDVRALFVTGTSDPDLVPLIRWAGQDNDPDAVELAVIRPALSEAAARMGILDAGGGIVAVLVQTAAMRPDPGLRLGGSLWIVAEVWNRREDLRARFSDGGVVDVRGLLTWASAVPVDDPDFAATRLIAGDMDRFLDDLPAPRRAPSTDDDG